jgi:aryl-phospho-beta-D-glucosidase BglC (GH1 family)
VRWGSRRSNSTIRQLFRGALTITLTAGLCVGLSVSSATAAVPLSIAVSGSHFVNGAGATVRLLGVNAPGTEYACEQGWGYSDAPLTAATASGIASWHATAVRVPLNEDCWLGLNGQPSYGTQSGYQAAIESWVADLNAVGLYVILDLHWSAPGSSVADGQRPMPDDHSVAFWTSVAATFASNPAVVFDAFNEPYSPQADGDSNLSVSWSCWLNGGCVLPVAADGTTPNDSITYTAVGMQAIVNAIRSTGASQPIMLGGLSYANDLSGWLANEPVDPDHQLAASFHNYYGEYCDTASCWNSTIATVAAAVPVVTGEFDQGFDCANPPTSPTALTSFDNTYMSWADQNGVSYLAWGWWVLGNTSSTCASLGGGDDNYDLVSNLSGTPVAPDGTNLQAHLASLVTNQTLPTVTKITPASGPGNGSTKVTITGTNFTGTNDVSFGATPAASFLVHSAKSIVAYSPPGAGTVDITVSTATGSSSSTVSDQFAFRSPAITALSPDYGSVGGGTKVTVRGSSFQGASSVLFGSVPAASYTVSSNGTSIVAYSPAQTPSTVDVTVTTPGGTSAVVSPDVFTFRLPTVTKIAPAHGAIGATVSVLGANLVGVTSVLFGTTPATFTVLTRTKISVVVPPGSGAQSVTVVTPFGSSTVVPLDTFT